MNLSKAVAENLGKVFLNIGQGTILGSFAAGFLAESVRLPAALLGFALGAYTVFIGLWLISGSERLED
jgi:uncharacterized membrane protein (Fun14 family)